MLKMARLIVNFSAAVVEYTYAIFQIQTTFSLRLLFNFLHPDLRWIAVLWALGLPSLSISQSPSMALNSIALEYLHSRM